MPRETTYRTAEAAAYLGICRETLEALAGRGEIIRYKIGGLWFYRESDLDAFEARRHAEGASEAAQRLTGATGKNVISLRTPRQTVTAEQALKVWKN